MTEKSMLPLKSHRTIMDFQISCLLTTLRQKLRVYQLLFV